MGMLLLTFTNVICRYFLSASISFTEEITCAAFVLLCMLGTAIAAKYQGHLGLSVITERLGEKRRLTLAAASNALGVVFSLILMKTGVEMALLEHKLQQITMALQWPEWIYGSFIPAGACFMVIRFAQAALDCAKKAKEVA